MKRIIPCELCKQEATFYCAADSAFLCDACDARVHGANFLVARHIRQPLHVSQDDDDDPADSISFSSSSSACISTTESAAAKRSGRNKIGRKKCMELTVTGSSSGITEVSSAEVDLKTSIKRIKMEEVGRRRVLHMNQYGPPYEVKYTSMTESERGVHKMVEGMFRSWCMKILGDEREISQHEVVVAAALRAMRLCMGVLPMRVALAASFWVALRMSKRVTASMSMAMLERVETVCGVPARLIVVAERRVARLSRTATTASAAKQNGCHHQLQEGWDENA